MVLRYLSSCLITTKDINYDFTFVWRGYMLVAEEILLYGAM
jgi:hypothetical protein